MANVIKNFLFITGDDLDNFIDEACVEGQLFCLENLAPVPEGTSQNDHWGAILRDDIQDQERCFCDATGYEKVRYVFYSCWNPPVLGLVHASERFPSFTFSLEWIDLSQSEGWPESRVGGTVEITNGEATVTDEGDIP